MTTAVALQRTVVDLINEYAEKHDAIEAAIVDHDAAFDRLGMAATVQGTFVEPVGNKSYLRADDLRKNLLRSGWKAIYARLQIDRVASAKDKQLFERTIAAPPPLTIENARATFGDYFERPRFHILRGMGAWAKQSSTGQKWAFGPGYVYRSALEPYIVGTRGKPKVRSHSVRNLIVAPTREHSRKPDQMHADVEAIYDGPRAELFSRQRRPGWDAWGNDVERFPGVRAGYLKTEFPNI